MNSLGQIVSAVEDYRKFVSSQVRTARADPRIGEDIVKRWRAAKERIGATVTPTGLRLPRLALPELDEPGEIARFLHEEGLPGEFPFVTAAYPEQYLEPVLTADDGSQPNQSDFIPEEPTRLFAGLGLPEETNERFHYLSRNQRNKRLSTAFDGPTLYGVGSGAEGVLGKVGEGGVSIDTVEDMERLYAGFDLDQSNVSVSMTISGPAPILLAMYVGAARRRFGPDVVPKLRGTIQADVLKEVQAQNELIFPIVPSLRLLADMVEFCSLNMRRWYPI